MGYALEMTKNIQAVLEHRLTGSELILMKMMLLKAPRTYTVCT